MFRESNKSPWQLAYEQVWTSLDSISGISISVTDRNHPCSLLCLVLQAERSKDWERAVTEKENVWRWRLSGCGGQPGLTDDRVFDRSG
jgi:hypothetical protein